MYRFKYGHIHRGRCVMLGSTSLLNREAKVQTIIIGIRIIIPPVRVTYLVNHVAKDFWNNPRGFYTFHFKLNSGAHDQNVSPKTCLWITDKVNYILMKCIYRIVNMKGSTSRRTLTYLTLSRIYALSRVKYPGLKFWLWKKYDKYQVWTLMCLMVNW